MDYGRFTGYGDTPPEKNGDFAWLLHILKSLKSTGKAAVILPHGVLFRNEESEMRENLIKSDMVEAVIGIGKNLFYNSPMEACILICRSKKPIDRLGKILFINAKHEVTRKNAESYLEDTHIEKIASAYDAFKDIEGFSHVADYEELKKNEFELSIALYIDDNTGVKAKPFETAYEDWNCSHSALISVTNELHNMLDGGKTDA